MEKKELELYIHIPFCKVSADIVISVPFGQRRKRSITYLGKLKEELIFWGKKLAARDVVTVFIGAERHHILEEKIFK